MLVQARTTKKTIQKLSSEAMLPAGSVPANHTQMATANSHKAATRLPHHYALGARQANRADLLQALLHSLVLSLHVCHQVPSQTSLSFH